MTRVWCGSRLSQNFAGTFPYSAADGSITQNVAQAKAAAEECAKLGGELQYFTTANTARDMDRIRMALGVPKISYWGQSYGTYLGAVYTTLFPQHTDRMVLEGNVDPNDVWQQQVQLWNQGMNDRFADAARVAAGGNAQLGLSSTVAQVTSAFQTRSPRWPGSGRHRPTCPPAKPRQPRTRPPFSRPLPTSTVPAPPTCPPTTKSA